MVRKVCLSINAALLLTAWAGVASAQDAAETAQILSGVSPSQGNAAQSAGSVFAQSMNAAAAEVRATGAGSQVAGNARQGAPRTIYVVPSNGDTLEGTDAPTYRLGNGASIRVTGTLVQNTGTACVKNCPPASSHAKATP